MSFANKLLTTGGFLSFFAFGFIDNLKGPLLPELLRSGEFSYSQGGTILFAGYVGFILATLLSGLFADAVSNRGVLTLAAVCLCIGSIGFGTSSSYRALIAFMSILGVGLGAIELGANGLMVELHSDARGRYLNLLAGFHGLGSLVVPLYAAWLINIGLSWQQIYFSSLALAVVLLLVFWPYRWKRSVASARASERDAAMQSQQRWDRATFFRLGFTSRMICYYVLIAAYVAVELSVAAWMMEFLQRERGMSVGGSSLVLSAFFVLLMLGRMAGAFVVEHVDTLLAVTVAILGSSLCLIGAIFGSQAWVALFSLSGLFMSIVFPTVTAAVTRLHIANTGTILGVLFACGGVGGALGPWSVGIVSDVAGASLGLASALAYAILALGAIACLKWLAHREASCSVS